MENIKVILSLTKELESSVDSANRIREAINELKEFYTDSIPENSTPEITIKYGSKTLHLFNIGPSVILEPVLFQINSHIDHLKKRLKEEIL